MNDTDPVRHLKQQLAREICALVQPVQQCIAAYTLDVDQPLISRLRHGDVERVSLDRLIRMLHRVGRTVTLSVASGPPIRFRFTPLGFLGRLSPEAAAAIAPVDASGQRVLASAPRRRRRRSPFSWVPRRAPLDAEQTGVALGEGNVAGGEPAIARGDCEDGLSRAAPDRAPRRAHPPPD